MAIHRIASLPLAFPRYGNHPVHKKKQSRRTDLRKKTLSRDSCIINTSRGRVFACRTMRETFIRPHETAQRVATRRALMARHTTNPISRQLAKYNRIALIRFASDIMGETLNLQTCRYSAVLGYVIHRLDSVGLCPFVRRTGM